MLRCTHRFGKRIVRVAVPPGPGTTTLVLLTQGIQPLFLHTAEADGRAVRPCVIRAGLHLPANQWPPRLRLGVCLLWLGVSRLLLAQVSTRVRSGVSEKNSSDSESARGSLSSHMKACNSHSTFCAFSNARQLKYTFTSFLVLSFDNLLRASVCTHP